MAEHPHLGDWMRQRRADLDLTQEALAEQVGCAVDTIRALENGRRRASRPMADRLGTILEIPPEERAAFVALARAPRQGHPRALAARAAEEPSQDIPRPIAPPPAAALLATKLFRPRAPQDVIVRPRLVERLDVGLAGPLTLISAPAGFGKTTLVAERLGRGALPHAWLALDAQDDAPGIFLRYFVAALHSIDRALGALASELLAVSGTAPAHAVMTALLNDLAALTQDVVVVLDDVHVLTHPAIYDALAYLLDHIPPRFHLVLISREDPALPLARLRARRHLVEVRAADLRFTVAEAEAFLRAAMRLSLEAENITALVKRTEGWVVGLQLAALSLRDLPAEAAGVSVDTFTGNNRFVVDYLVDEVIAGQPPHLQQFLLHTSILHRLCGPLCDAVRLPEEPAASAAPPAQHTASGQDLLEVLERANLFLLPLDTERRWYRYHHLFAEVLQARLVSGTPPARVMQLRQRASTWCEAQGLLAEAVHYALEAHDWPRVVRLIEGPGTPYALNGHIETVLGWLNAVPDIMVRARPALCLLQTGLFLSTQQMQRAAERLQWTEVALTNAPQLRSPPINAQLAAMRSTLARFRGDLPQSVVLAQQALREMPGQHRNAAMVISAAHEFLVTGDVSPAAEEQLMVRLAELDDDAHPAIALRRALLWAWMRVLQGRLREAAEAYQAAVQAVPGHEAGLVVIVGSAAPAFGLGDLLREWNDLDGATQRLAQGMNLARGTLAVEPDVLLGGVLALARAQQARGDVRAAQATLHEFAHLARDRTQAPHLQARIAAMEAELALRGGQLDRAVQWATTSGLHPDDALSYLREPEYLTLARVRIAQARGDPTAPVLDETLSLLDRLLTAAAAGTRRASLIPILILRALALDVQRKQHDALDALARALTLAAPEGYVRVFVDEGAPLAVLLHDLGLREPRQVQTTRAYAHTLLAAFPDIHMPTNPRMAETVSPVPAGMEPLTERELQVLKLIAAGRSNQAIAAELVVAVGTVKRHVSNILDKLQAQSRLEAAARARDLGLA